MPRVSDEKARLRRARNRGYKDRYKGVLAIMNPYRAIDSRLEWHDGWLEADHDIQDTHDYFEQTL